MHSQLPVDITELDQEWLDLILEAKKLGLSVEEVHYFLQQESVPNFTPRKTEVNHSNS
ncbi:anti-repressor SinI family protein [Oceanobacillus massiliensis]|uniref:anti-repressor SinI family protein n=1 Tax=Oceanobacillus massiliensis TaxID=1465765 RepID=UPI0002895D2D|nr:anti-repressor SinI family protein [Oceanobacillus massiliensis]